MGARRMGFFFEEGTNPCQVFSNNGAVGGGLFFFCSSSHSCVGAALIGRAGLREGREGGLEDARPRGAADVLAWWCEGDGVIGVMRGITHTHTLSHSPSR